LYFDSANATKNSINELSVATNSSHKLRVISSIFPIDKFIKIGDDMIQSSILFPTRIESHDFEPTIIQIQTVDSANVLVYNDLGLKIGLQKLIMHIKLVLVRV
jgi:ABC-type Zn uptake system ZnuABC Zn-binding protein ZnuA